MSAAGSSPQGVLEQAAHTPANYTCQYLEPVLTEREGRTDGGGAACASLPRPVSSERPLDIISTDPLGSITQISADQRPRDQNP